MFVAAAAAKTRGAAPLLLCSGSSTSRSSSSDAATAVATEAAEAAAEPAIAPKAAAAWTADATAASRLQPFCPSSCSQRCGDHWLTASHLFVHALAQQQESQRQQQRCQQQQLMGTASSPSRAMRSNFSRCVHFGPRRPAQQLRSRPTNLLPATSMWSSCATLLLTHLRARRTGA